MTHQFRAMNPSEVRDARLALGLTQHELAVLLRMGGDGKRSVRRWEAGDREISGPASVAIEALLTGWRPSKPQYQHREGPPQQAEGPPFVVPPFTLTVIEESNND